MFFRGSSNSKIHISAQIFFMGGTGYVHLVHVLLSPSLYGHAPKLPVNKMFVLDLQVYYWVISSNLILRCTWTYKLSAHLRHNYLTVFTIAALEIFRRFQWIFFRVENEWNKMTTLRPSLELVMDDVRKEDERLLGSSNHDV